jgi:hypothetical protein
MQYVAIDTEYWGYESEIKGMILAYFHREGIRVSPNRLTFRPVGKNSHAHALAIRTYRGEFAEDQCVTEAEFLAVLKRK